MVIILRGRIAFNDMSIGYGLGSMQGLIGRVVKYHSEDILEIASKNHILHTYCPISIAQEEGTRLPPSLLGPQDHDSLVSHVCKDYIADTNHCSGALPT